MYGEAEMKEAALKGEIFVVHDLFDSTHPMWIECMRMAIYRCCQIERFDVLTTLFKRKGVDDRIKKEIIEMTSLFISTCKDPAQLSACLEVFRTLEKGKEVATKVLDRLAAEGRADLLLDEYKQGGSTIPPAVIRSSVVRGIRRSTENGCPGFYAVSMLEKNSDRGLEGEIEAALSHLVGKWNKEGDFESIRMLGSVMERKEGYPSLRILLSSLLPDDRKIPPPAKSGVATSNSQRKRVG